MKQVSFYGELSPKILARVDIEKRQSGVEQSRNMISIPHGSSTRRPGTEFVARTKFHDKNFALYGYEFSTEQTYILEFGYHYIRYYKDGGQILASQDSITNITNANPCVVTVNNTLTNGVTVRITGVKGMTELNEGEYIVANRTASTIELQGVDSTTYGAYAGGGYVDEPYETTTTYTDTEVEDLDFSSVNDVIYIAHQKHAPAKLTRFGHTNWVLSTISFTSPPAEWGTNDYPAINCFDNDRLIWARSPSHPLRMWVSKSGIYNDLGKSSPVVADDGFSVDLVTKRANAIMWMLSARRFAVGTTGAEFWITSSTGDGVMTALSKKATPGSWNGSSKTVPEMAGSTLLYVSSQGKSLKELNYEFSKDSYTGDDLTLIAEHLLKDGYIKQIVMQKAPYKLLWARTSDGRLIAMTYYPEHEVYGWHQHPIGGKGKIISLSSIEGSEETEVWMGVERTINGNTVKYIERLHSFFDDDDTINAFFIDSGLSFDNRQSVDSISFANPGIIYKTAHGYSNGDVVTFRTKDKPGQESYRSLHRERWTVSDANAGNFKVKDNNGNYVDLTGYKRFETCTVALNQLVVTGLAHLEGETVDIFADGATRKPKKVIRGQITLDTYASVGHIGLNEYAQIITLPQYAETQQGDTFAKQQRIVSVIVELYKTLGMKIGEDENNLQEYDFISDQVPMGQAGDLYTGFTEDITFGGSYRRDPKVIIRQDQPAPITILAIRPNLEIGDD